MTDTIQWSRLFRPENIDDLVVGNPEILGEVKLAAKKTLAMLVVGEYGTGKTTLARALANEINGNQSSTIEEPSTERGKAYIERLQERVRYSPSGKKWVVIIDECHALTKDAFSALLKLLEDPPHKRVIFILCTNHVRKIPPEIVSRCKKIEIEKPEMKPALLYLSKILKSTGLKLSKEDRIKVIKKAVTDANFGMRQAVENLESIHDRIKSGTPVSKILTGKYATETDAESVGDVENIAGSLLLAIFKAKDDPEKSVNYILATISNSDVINVVERMAGILYYGYILQHGGKWNWQSKPFKAIFGNNQPKTTAIMKVLDGLTTLREQLKDADGDITILAAVSMAKLAAMLTK